jgi:serine/threonine protein kinase
VKVADFGLAKVIQEKDYYKVAGRAVLPVRWMAPESLLFGVFTSASDVWSYGVLLWEIASYGTLPFESCQVQEIVGMAQNRTLDHPWPVDGPEELMTLKEQCHHYEPENRPNFQEIHSILHGSNS